MNFIEFHNEFRAYFNEDAPARIEEIMNMEHRGKLHNKFCSLRTEYIIEFTKRYGKLEKEHPHEYLALDKVDSHAEHFVNELLNEYLSNRKKAKE